MQSRTTITAGRLSVFLLLALSCMPADPDSSGTGGAASGSGGKAGTGGASGTGGAGTGTGGAAPSCTPMAGSSRANLAGMVEIVHFYCGGSGCHNEGQAPKLFDDANLYTLLTTYKVAKCGNRPLVQPCKPDDSAIYRVVQGMCEGVEKMPKGCVDMCVDPSDLAPMREWIANGAPK